MTELSIRRLTSGGVITNYHCVSRCGHCLYNCGPHRTRDYLEEAAAGNIFRRIAELGCRSVHIGGGEPLLEPGKLAGVLAAARDAGVSIDYVETNSAWFIDSSQAAAVLKDLLASGVRTLLVSISPFHNAHIPFARVRGVIDACRRTGMHVFPWVEDFTGDLGSLDEHRTHSMAEYDDAFGPGYLERIPDRCWIHLGGRALETFRPVYPSHPAGQILENSPPSCARVLGDTTHFHIDLYGNYIPGLCSGLAIAMDDLGREQPPGKYPLLDRLAAAGVRGLYDLARTCGYTPQRSAYLNHCDLCTEIRHFLLRLDGKRFPELAPEEFYGEPPPAD